MWLSRRDYEKLVKSNDDRDFAAMRKEVEAVHSSVRALRTWLQRNLDSLALHDDDDGGAASSGAPVAIPVPGGWSR